MIRGAEVGPQSDSQDFGCTDRNIRVTGEITVDLIAEGRRCKHQRRSGDDPRMGIDRIDQRSQAIGHDHLFEQPPSHQLQAVGDTVVIEILEVMQLRQELTGPFDRTGHQLREKNDERGKRPPVPLRLRLPAIHVEHVTHRLNRVKRKAEREDDRQIGEQICLLPIVHGLGHERVVLEYKQNGQIRGHTDRQDRTPRCRARHTP